MQFGGGGGSDSDVLQGMRAVQGGGGQSAAADADAARRAAAVAAEQAKALEAQKTSYVALLAELLPLASNSEALSARVKDEYIKFDYTFMKVCDDVKKSDPDQAAKIDAVINEVTRRKVCLRAFPVALVFPPFMPSSHEGKTTPFLSLSL
jgi:hypothetical protein